jgi:hypothetical protein
VTTEPGRDEAETVSVGTWSSSMSWFARAMTNPSRTAAASRLGPSSGRHPVPPAAPPPPPPLGGVGTVDGEDGLELEPHADNIPTASSSATSSPSAGRRIVESSVRE